MTSEIKQPLLEGPDRPLLLEGPPVTPSASQVAPRGATRSPEERLQDEQNARYARGASRVVTYTVWFLLAAVMIGTIVGIVFVTLPMQQGSIPAPRKSAALLVTSTADQRTVRALGSRQFGKVQDKGVVEAVVWSGKGRHSPVPFNDIYTFNAITTIWNDITAEVQQGGGSQLPIQRWKTVAVREPEGASMLIQGGDPLLADGPADHYLDDTWRLSLTDPHQPVWTQLETLEANGSDIRPSPRRAHVGVIYYVDGVPTLTIHGGRAKDGQLLSDVWSTSLANATHLAWSLRRELENASSTTADDALSNNETFSTDVTGNFSLTKHHHHHKRSEKNYPEARKGHLAVAIQDSPHHPLMIILGGRNDTNYFDDMWQYDHKGNSWTHLKQRGHSMPTPRDHLGGFHHNGLLYIFGGRGAVDDEYISAAPLGDLWTYDLKTEEWTQLHPKGPQPSARFLYGMDTYSDGEGDVRFVIMGGEGQKSCYLNDLWEYSVLQNEWKQWGALKVEPGREKCQNL